MKANATKTTMDKSADQSVAEEMAPHHNQDPDGTTSEDVAEKDLQEMVAVNNSLDELSSALDFFEQRTDSIIEQLKELLHSNREIRKELQQEQQEGVSEGGDNNSS